MVENETVFFAGGQGIPDPRAPILNIQQSIPGLPEIDLNLPFAGEPGLGFNTPFGRASFGESQEVRMQASGLPMLGPFGTVPVTEARAIRRCPPGHRLALDGLCYPKALLAKRSKLRAWPAEMAPPITRADARALNKIDSVQKKIKTMGKKAHLKVTK